jgi:hypothetical protein
MNRRSRKTRYDLRIIDGSNVDKRSLSRAQYRGEDNKYETKK